MPIPKQLQKEFFIPPINQYYLENNNDQAVIYDPNDDDSNNYRSYRSIINFSNFYLPRTIYSFIFPFYFPVEIKFISDITKIFLKIINSNNSSFSQNINVYSNQFDSCIKHFLKNQDSKDIYSLSYNFYLEISSNEIIQNLLGPKLSAFFRKRVLIYYKVQLRQEYFKQFNEFKVFQNYREAKVNHQMKFKIKVRNHFLYQYKNRKIKYLQSTI